MPVSLYDDFDNPQGEFIEYDAYDLTQLIALGGQKHADIRSFGTATMTPYVMYNLDTRSMATLDSLSMQALETANVLQQGENWTVGTVGPQSDLNNVSGISVFCPAGLTTSTSSVLGGGQTVDLSQFDTMSRSSLPLLFTLPSDLVSVTLPSSGTTGQLDLANSYIDFTSNDDGNFSAGPTANIVLSATVNVAPQTQGRFDYSLANLAGINWAAITGVRFRFKANVDVTVRCTAIRCFANTWKYAPFDQNTLYNRIQKTVPPATGAALQFPTAARTPSDWPILFFADPVEADPEPVDVEVGTVIHTGSGAQTNTFSLYLRESPLLFNTQSVLNGQSMNQMALAGDQPDAVVASGALAPISMYGLDNAEMTVLDGETMGDLESSTRVSTRYIVVTLNWGLADSLHIKDQSRFGYDFPETGLTGISLSTFTDYYFLVTLLDDSVRAQIYPLSPEGYINWDLPTYDSTAVIDGSFVYRRKGRLGWYAQLKDGDTYINSLRPRYLVHNEYRSLPLTTETPTEGAQLFAGASPDIELLTDIIPTSGTALIPDLTRSSSGHCLRVVCDGELPLEGLRTAPMRFENLQESYIDFDLMAPAGLQLEMLLIGESRYLLLELDIVLDNTWQHLSIPLDSIGRLFQPGVYYLALIQTPTAQHTWYVDNLSIATRSVAWAGRQAADPWKMSDPNWVPFNATINKPNDGILFDRGNRMQVRGRGLTQNATINSVKILPKYSQLGNFTWTDNLPVSQGTPTAHFGLTSVGTTISADGRASGSFSSGGGVIPPSSSVAALTGLGTILPLPISQAPNGIAAYSWSFGDGTYAYGPQVMHTYTVQGVYTVTLTVIDYLGLTASSSSITTTITTGIVSLPLVFTR